MYSEMVAGNLIRIVFIGFRGAGKSTLASELSKALGWPVLHPDQLIERQQGMPISHLVQKKGWEYFRQLEQDFYLNNQLQTQVIWDCGGGIVENPLVMKKLRSGSLIIWVDAALEDIMHRLAKARDRPLLSEKSLRRDVEINYSRRAPLYFRYSDFYVTTSGYSAGENVQFILERIKKYER